MRIWFPGILLSTTLIVTGCANGGSVSSFRGAPFPVMFGLKNRLGRADPIPATKVDTWWAESVSFIGTQDSGGYRTTTTTEADSSFMAETAESYLKEKNDPGLELSVTSIDAVAYVSAFGGAQKEYVHVDADVVRQGGVK
jgi:hypothetical protein